MKVFLTFVILMDIVMILIYLMSSKRLNNYEINKLGLKTWKGFKKENGNNDNDNSRSNCSS